MYLPRDCFSGIVLSHSGKDLDMPLLVKGREGRKFHYFIGNGSLNRDGRIYSGRAERISLRRTDDFLRICLLGNLKRSPPTQMQMITLVDILQQKLLENNLSVRRILFEGKDLDGSGNLGEYLSLEYVRSQVESRFTIYDPSLVGLLSGNQVS